MLSFSRAEERAGDAAAQIIWLLKIFNTLIIGSSAIICYDICHNKR